MIRKPVDAHGFREAVFGDPRIKGNTLAVALAMAQRSDYRTGSKSSPSAGTVGTMVGLARENANRHVKALEGLGYLTWTGGYYVPRGSPKSRTKVYQLTVPEESGEPPPW